MPRGKYHREPKSSDPSFVPMAPGRAVGHVVNTLTGCWEWCGSKDRKGYGHAYSGKHRSANDAAHRLYYMTVKGDIPAGLQLDHLCRNRGCVNPDHLEIVTAQQNSSRGAWAMKTHCPSGHPYDENNTTWYHNRRGCRICQRRHKRTYKEAQKAARAVRAAAHYQVT